LRRAPRAQTITNHGGEAFRHCSSRVDVRPLAAVSSLARLPGRPYGVSFIEHV
jgi:hypothetical protein